MTAGLIFLGLVLVVYPLCVFVVTRKSPRLRAVEDAEQAAAIWPGYEEHA